jgi:hypothetical protein
VVALAGIPEEDDLGWEVAPAVWVRYCNFSLKEQMTRCHGRTIMVQKEMEPLAEFLFVQESSALQF